MLNFVSCSADLDMASNLSECGNQIGQDHEIKNQIETWRYRVCHLQFGTNQMGNLCIRRSNKRS